RGVSAEGGRGLLRLRARVSETDEQQDGGGERQPYGNARPPEQAEPHLSLLDGRKSLTADGEIPGRLERLEVDDAQVVRRRHPAGRDEAVTAHSLRLVERGVRAAHELLGRLAPVPTSHACGDGRAL